MRTRAIVVSVVAGLGLATLGLSACTPTAPAAETPPAASSSASAEPTPEPSTSAAAVAVTIPTDCATLVDTATYAATFGQVPLNDPSIAANYPLGVLTPVAPAAGASAEEVLTAATQLRCLWRHPDADISNLQVEIATVDPATTEDYLATLPPEGYTCETTLGGTRCQLISIEPQYKVEEGDTLFLRDNVFIHVTQDNVATKNLLGAIVARIWPAAG